MNNKLLNWFSHVFFSIALALCTSLSLMQIAQASTFHHEDEYYGGGCHGGGSSLNCGQTATKYFYDFMDDGVRDDGMVPLSGNSTNISINYTLASGWNIDSAWLRIWAKDDASNIIDGTGSYKDPSETVKYTLIEGTSITMAESEINGVDWYLLYNVTSLLNGTPFTATIKSITGDFKYMNAELKFNTSTDPCPPPNAVPLPAALPLMLSSLGVLGFASRRRKQTA